MKLTSIRGIGEARQQELKEQGIETKEQLKERIDEVNIPDISELDLKYNISKHIPRAILDEIKERLPRGFELVGSYRRGTQTSSDVDILTTKRHIPRFLHGMIIYRDAEKITAGIWDPKLAKIDYPKYVKLDIFRTTKEEYPFALLHYTGPYTYSTRIRMKAKRNNLKLNQYGLFEASTGKRITDTEFKKESDIQKYIGVKERDPTKRF